MGEKIKCQKLAHFQRPKNDQSTYQLYHAIHHNFTTFYHRKNTENRRITQQNTIKEL